MTGFMADDGYAWPSFPYNEGLASNFFKYWKLSAFDIMKACISCRVTTSKVVFIPRTICIPWLIYLRKWRPAYLTISLKDHWVDQASLLVGQHHSFTSLPSLSWSLQLYARGMNWKVTSWTSLFLIIPQISLPRESNL
jgi:hypothetical protein